ncbi:LytTR family DNA-binding domain-containing protein [Enterococcus alishanensis]|uniref:LytTR family transcriptional regulator n=1 Tax=Enterococcus alishanensis TaxID=1303817 RepID=A0ABS6TH92_9ENTE|nr:LytTR family DNA-binding domain-containing protein [Enterococcus alishanensis]MBV7392342.1 LytTR family transcriptional regulator [Enterococcus alishanensis]
MKINWLWDKNYPKEELGVTLHPVNEKLTNKLQSLFTKTVELEVIQPVNERRFKIDSQMIFMIEAMDQLSKVYTNDDQVFYLKGRLKDFTDLQAVQLFRINNSVILNLAQVTSFKNGQYARLEVFTKNGQTFSVSRHYAKQIKEALQ